MDVYKVRIQRNFMLLPTIAQLPMHLIKPFLFPGALMQLLSHRI